VNLAHVVDCGSSSVKDQPLEPATGQVMARGLVERIDDPDVRLTLDVPCYRIRCHVGAYFATLGQVGAVVFTAGVGEHSAEIRTRSLTGLQAGIVVDERRNRAPGNGAHRVSSDEATVDVLVVPTAEEPEIATQALAVAVG
jgi:acetate kinase